MPNIQLRQTISVLIAGFSFVILSSYLVLWSHRNQDMRIVIVCAVFFVIGVFLAPRKDAVICAAFLFAACRWGIVAFTTHGVRPVIATIVLLAVPLLWFYLESRKQKPIL